jgi:hypothetical protein
MLKTIFKIGDRVKYSTIFLRSIGCYTGPLPFAKGTITNLQQFGSRVSGTTLATIDWNSKDIPDKVNVANLTRCK